MPPLSLVPQIFSSHQSQELSHQIQLLLAKQAIEPVLPPLTPGFYSHLFVVPKANGNFRPIIDLSRLNQFLKIPSFFMESVFTIQKALEGSLWAVTLDLSDAYFHVPIHHKARHLLRFSVNHQVFQFKVLPFGLASAPFVFTWILRPFLGHLRKQGIQIHAYLDDWIIHHSDKNTLLQHLHMTLSLASQLGFKVNLGKSKLILSQDLTYLGVCFRLDLQLAMPSEVHLQQIRTWVSLLLHQDNLPARKWAQFLGLLNFVAHFIPHGSLAIRPIHQHLAANSDFDWNHADTPIPQAPSLTQDLLQWTDPQFVAQGIPLLPPQAHGTLFTDASLEGWGAHYHQHQASGLWSLEESTLHINILEMKAVLLAITQLQSVLKGHVIVIATDNTTVLGYLKNQGGTKCPGILPWTYQVFHLCQSLNISFTARHVPGRKNVLADQLSRKDQAIQTEWTLRLDVCHWLWKKWFLPQVDAFATLWTHRLPLYFSPLPDPRALAVDALSQQWTTHTLFLFPSTPLLPAVLRKLQRPHQQAILVVPWNQTSTWFPLLLRLTQEQAIDVLKLPTPPNLLGQPLNNLVHPNLHQLNLHAVWLQSLD